MEQATCFGKRHEWQEGYRKFSQRHLTHIVTAIPLVLACPLLNTAMSTSKEIVTLIMFSPKREKILGGVKSNVECDEVDNNASPGLAMFSAT